MHDPHVILALKIVLISGFTSLAAWIGVYTCVARWWENRIGRTLVALAALVALLFVPLTLSLFFHLSDRDSRAAGWTDVVLIGLVTPVMLQRCLAWLRLYRAGKLRRGGNEGTEH